MESGSQATAPLESERLCYRRLADDMLEEFHKLVVNDHVRRFLLDGEAMGQEWCLGQIGSSDALFDSHGVGIWLVYTPDHSDPIGFCGFIRFPETGPDPQLLYALLEEYTGNGYATEMARALVAYATRNTSFTVLFSAVDEPNTASSRVLEKVGFEAYDTRPGAFGRILEYRRQLP